MASRTSPVTIEINPHGIDRAWDNFVDRVPGGHHVQTSLWAEVKAVVRWRAARIVVRQDGDIVAGCQVLIRGWRRSAGVGYVTRGPLGLDARGRAAALDGLDRLVRRHRVVYLKVQPPPGGCTAADLEDRGFVPSALAPGPTATVLVDVGRSPEELLSAMRPGTRSNIRKAQRKGVTFRGGDAGDLPAFCRLVETTSQRQRFSPYPPAYYETMWQVFSSVGRAHLVIGEYQGSVCTALLLIGYGDTVVYKMGGWSGDRSGVHPNEGAHWAGMAWAREAGYRYYDLEGIERTVAVAMNSGELPQSARPGIDHFKLGFGGEVVLLPEAFDRSHVPVLSGLVRLLAPNLDRWQGVALRLVGRRP